MFTEPKKKEAKVKNKSQKTKQNKGPVRARFCPGHLYAKNSVTEKLPGQREAQGDEGRTGRAQLSAQEAGPAATLPK